MAAAADRKDTQATKSAHMSDVDQLRAKEGRVLTVAVFLFVTCSVVQTARRVRDEPWDLAFVVLVYADLATLFWCVWRTERLVKPANSSPAAWEKRRRLQVAVWVLSTALSCAFAYRVSLVMPAAQVIVVWCMTSFVVLVGFYVMVVCNDPGYRVLEDYGGDGNGLALVTMESADELV